MKRAAGYRADLHCVQVLSVLADLGSATVFSARARSGAAFRVVGRGALFRPLPGDVYDIRGTWLESRRHGLQLYADGEAFVRRPPTGRLVAAWLQRIPGIGAERALRLVREFGTTLGDALSDASMFDRIVKAIDADRLHLAARIAAEAVTLWAELRGEYEAVSWLETQGVEDLRVARKIAELLGAEASAVLRQNPYVLVGVLPWQTADKVALRILSHGAVDRGALKTSTRRIVGAIDAVMRDVLADGHTAVLKDGFCDKVRLKLGCHVADERVIELGTRNRAIFEGGIVWRCPGCAFMEAELEARFERMARGEEPSRIRTRPDADLRRILAFVSHDGRELGSEQVNAAVCILGSDLACLTGGAGTGKTTTCRAIVRAWEALGGRVELAALSGKAALRLAEGVGRTGPDHRPALTMQRLLIGLRKRAAGETQWGAELQNGQARPVALQLPELTDQTLLILDEASMIDLGQFHALIEVMPRGCRLLLVGDSFQLPPVGVGLVFHRLVERLRPSIRLDIVRRQAESSGIPAISQAVRLGIVPELPSWSSSTSGVTQIECVEGEVTQSVVRLVEQLGVSPGGPELLVLSPVHRRGRADGTVNDINRALQRARGVADTGTFAVGDPVCFTRNDYVRDLRNGSLGIILSANPVGFRVSFDGIEHDVSDDEIVLAYAVTCHKAQGVQSRIVIIALINAINVDPSWIYTAVTRAEDFVIVVGPKSSLDRAMARIPAFKKRVVSEGLFSALAG